MQLRYIYIKLVFELNWIFLFMYEYLNWKVLFVEQLNNGYDFWQCRYLFFIELKVCWMILGYD